MPGNLTLVKPESILQHLETAAESIRVRVSCEAISAVVGLGGLCRVKGQHRVIIDKRAGAEERVVALAEALGTLDTSSVNVPKEVRALLDLHAVRRATA